MILPSDYARACELLAQAEEQALGVIGESFVKLDDVNYDSVRVWVRWEGRNCAVSYAIVYRRDADLNAEQLRSRRVNPRTYEKRVDYDKAVEAIRAFHPEIKARLAAVVAKAVSQ